MSLEQLLGSAQTEAGVFRNLQGCLTSTAEAHGTETITILKYLDSVEKYSGIRGLYNSLAAKHRFPKVPKFSGTRKSAEALVANLPVLVTGARPGEIILGTKTQSKDAVLKVHSAIVPPKMKDLDTIREYEDLWRRFLGRLSSIEFFSDLTNLEKEMWLEEMEDEFDVYLEDVEGLQLEVLQPSGDFLDLEEEDIETLGAPGAILPAREIVDMFPKKPGSEGLKGRHTLIFRRGIWKVSVVYRETRSYDGVVIDVEDAEICSGATAERDATILLFDTFAEKYNRSAGKWKVADPKQTIGFLVQRNPGRLTPDEVWKMVLKGDTHTQDDIERVKFATRNFTAASYKSLLQKTIRFRAEEVDIGGYLTGSFTYPSDFVLKVCIGALLLNPGSFVPDIQRFVSGIESALKRVVVTLFEDAFIPLGSDENTTLSITAGAFLAQRAPVWKPTNAMIKRVLAISVEALDSSDAFTFDIPAGSKLPPYVITGKSTPLETVSALMEEIRSFGSDLAMIRYIVSQRTAGREKITSLEERPKVMPLGHCVDQHWAPEIAYMYPTSVIYPLKSPGSKPFSGLFIRIFSEVTGINPRRPPRKGRTMHPQNYDPDFEERPFVGETRKAQSLTLMSRQLSREDMTSHTETGGAKTLKYTLDKGWIAGMLGAAEVKGRPPALVTLHPEDPEIFVAVRKPSRDMKDAFLTDERETEAIDEVKKHLRKGLPLNKSHAPIPELKGAKLVYRQSEMEDEGDIFYIQTRDGRETEWELFRQSFVKVPYIEDVPLTVENALMHTGQGIVKDADEKLRGLLEETDIGDVRRAMMYLAAYGSEFEFARLGREGGGTKQAVSIHDVGAWQLTLKVSLLYPSALQRVPGNALRFRVPLGPLLWHVRSILAEHLAAGASEGVDARSVDHATRWGDTGDTLGRKPWEHQTTSVEEMKVAHQLGRKGHFIWIDVGMGKCLHPDTPVLMWDGQIKPVKDIVEGDLLVGDDSKPRRVLSTCTGRETMYQVSQTKGDDYIVNASHILTLKLSGHKGWWWSEKYNRYETRYLERSDPPKMKFKVFSVGEGSRFKFSSREQARGALFEFLKTIDDDPVIDINVEDYTRLPKNFQTELKGFKVGVDYPLGFEVGLDPYVLGVWLGDGHTSNAAVTNVDEDVLQYLEEWCDTRGYTMAPRKHDPITYNITGGFRVLLREMNLLDNKHIPREYITNSREVRLRVLAGLIDTDGYLTDNCYEIIQKSETLAKDIAQLSRSLGFGCTLRDVEKVCTNSPDGLKKGVYWKCIIFGEGLEEIPCLLERKRASPRMQTKDALVSGIKITRLDEGDYCGFEIDGNGRFLLGDYTVTHNTFIVLSYLKWLQSTGALPRYVIYTLPSSAISSIRTEIEAFGFKCKLLVPLKTLKKVYLTKGGKPKSYVKKGCEPEEYTINLIEHDHLRRCEDILPEYMPDSVFVIDEVHKCLNETKRTAVALQLSHLSQEFIALTGTPIIDSNTYKLIWWLEQIVPFEVNEKNFWVAANGMVAKKVNTGVKVDREDVEILLDAAEEKDYAKLVPPGLGGRNSNPRPEDLRRAMEVCYTAADRGIVEETVAALGENHGVFVVAKDKEHQARLRDLIIRAAKSTGLKSADVFLIDKDHTLFLTDASVKDGRVHDYRVVITTIRHSEGYTLTRLNTMVTGVYPSNNATREQLEGRINRIGQTSDTVHYRIVHAGILTYILQRHNDARNLSAVLSALAEEISM